MYSLAGNIYSIVHKILLLLNCKIDHSYLIYIWCLVEASFFITYVVTIGWTNIASELFQLSPFLYNYINIFFVGHSDDDDFEVLSIQYHWEIPGVLFFGLLGVTYFILAPLILPFLLVYFSLGYIIYRNQVCKLFLFFHIYSDLLYLLYNMYLL